MLLDQEHGSQVCGFIGRHPHFAVIAAEEAVKALGAGVAAGAGATAAAGARFAPPSWFPPKAC